MKRLFAVVLAVLTLAGFSMKRVELVGADMTMDAPAGWLVLSREENVLEESAKQFGMTAEEAVQFMEENDFYLILYEPESGAEIYVTIFGSEYAGRMWELAALSEAEMEKAKQDVVENAPEWMFDSAVTEETLGDLVYLAAQMHWGEGAERTDSRQLFTVYGGNELYIDLYAGDNGIEEEHIQAQDALAESLRVGVMMQRIGTAYKVYVATMVGIMLAMLVQVVGVAMTIMVMRVTRRG